MNRRTAREHAFIAMFELSFGGALADILEYSRTDAEAYAIDEFGEGLLRSYLKHSEKIDEKIESKLKGWTAGRIPRVSMAVLRLAVTEMWYTDPDVDSIVINEAVELTKEYGADGDHQFVNGVLGSISREEAGKE